MLQITVLSRQLTKIPFGRGQNKAKEIVNFNPRRRTALTAPWAGCLSCLCVCVCIQTATTFSERDLRLNRFIQQERMEGKKASRKKKRRAAQSNSHRLRAHANPFSDLDIT